MTSVLSVVDGVGDGFGPLAGHSLLQYPLILFIELTRVQSAQHKPQETEFWVTDPEMPQVILQKVAV